MTEELSTSDLPSTSDKVTTVLLTEIYNKMIDLDDQLKKLVVEPSSDTKRYDKWNTIATAQATDPDNFNNANYNREPVYVTLHRIAQHIWIVNHGTDSLYVRVSHDGIQSFTGEVPIYPQQTKKYDNVFEIRLRSPTAGTPYTISETILFPGSNIVTPVGGFATEATLAAMNAKFISGNDIGDVTINNAGGVAAVNIQDGGNSITIDGAVTANAGTNLNTSLLALETGGNLASIKTGTDNLIPGTSITNGQTNVITAGTRVQLAANACKWIIIKAKSVNTGNIFVGNSTVAAANGYILTPGEAIGLDVNNSNLVYIDSAVSGEGTSWILRN